MSKRCSRSAKVVAKKLINKAIQKDRQAELNFAPTQDKAGIVVDLFRSVNDEKTRPPPLLEEDDFELELTQGRMTCQWKARSNAKKICGKIFNTVEDLLSHFMADHKHSSSQGYVCRWSSCPLEKSNFFSEESELEEHVKEEILNASVIIPSRGRKTPLRKIRLKSKDNEIDPDFIDSSDDEVTAKRSKKTQSSETMLKNACLEPSSTVCLSFYRFTCLWIVPFNMKNKDGTEVKTDVTCMRKFTVIDESLNHLIGHHLAKMKDEKLPIKCCWQNCSEKSKLFSSIGRLKEHVKVHVEEKMLKINTAGTVPMESCPGSSQVGSSVVTSTVSSPPKSKGHVDLPIDITEDRDVEADSTKIEENWMDFVILSLTNTRINSKHESCDPSISCYFCLFVSWRRRLSQNKSEMFSLPHEFAELQHTSRGVFESPSKFLGHLLKLIVRDELANHKTSVFKNTYCLESVKLSDRSRCRKHKIKDNLCDLFPASCLFCADRIEAWHKKSHENVMFVLDRGEKDAMIYPQFLTICERDYRLEAVVVHGPRINELYRFIHNAWIKNCSTSEVVDQSEALGNSQAVLVVYTLNISDSETEAPVFGECYKEETKDEVAFQKTEQEDENPDSTQIGLCQKNAADTTTNVAGTSSQFIVKIEENKPEEDIANKVDIGEAFTYRTMTSESPNSCLFSVLHVIFQTSLTASGASPKKHYTCSAVCLYCTVCNLIKRVLENTKGFPVDVSPLHELGVASDPQGDPASFMHHLVTTVVEHQIQYHREYSTKYKFMVQVQKKTCSCMMSSEEYQWTVEPTKKHEDLLSLLGKMTKMCLGCAKLTSVQPISMPENLIITIKRAEDYPEASVHFPDEWGSCDGRYILAAIIVQEPSSPNASQSKYVCYCKVFGKWIRYDGNAVTPARPSDVLGNENACLLLYVTSEITPDALRSSGCDA